MENELGAMETIRVLLVEDDARLARLTQTYLEKKGLLVAVRGDGLGGLEEAVGQVYDVVLIDRMLPGMDGMEVCSAIRRATDVPIIMVTALGDVEDRVEGLSSGADDYMCKPFSAPELLARIRAAVRRYRGGAGPSHREASAGGIHVDPRSLTATLDGRNLDLTSYEFAILRVLVENAGRVLSRERILDLAKGSAEEAFERSIDGHISRLRRKLEDDPSSPRLIKTIRGAGYLLAIDGAASC